MTNKISPTDIKSNHTLEVSLPNNRKMFIFTGNAIINYNAEDTPSYPGADPVSRAVCTIVIDIPGIGREEGKVFVVEEQAPYATFSSVQSTPPEKSLAVWAVDQFRLEIPLNLARKPNRVSDALRLVLDIAVGTSKSKSIIWRLAYHVTIVGYYDNFTPDDEGPR